MSSVSIQGNASGTGIFTIASPNSNTNRTLTLPDATGTIITTAGGAAISGTTGAFTSTVGVGGATPAASGAGITFPATASASSDANTLDDYEEGTWTPTVTGGTTAGTTTYTGQYGFYTKIGRTVTVACEVAYSAATGTGNLRIGGIPFAGGGATGAQYLGSVMTNNLNLPNSGWATSYINGGGGNSFIEMFSSTDDGGLTQVTLSNEAATIYVEITYFTS